MITIFILAGPAVIIIITALIARSLGVKIIDLEKGKVEFRKPVKEKDIIFKPCFSLDPVISSDGEIYKVHVIISIFSIKNISPSNWTLKIHGLKSFNFKQYFYQDDSGKRIPLGKIPKLPIKINENFVIGLEFEPEEKYESIIFEEKVYKTLISCSVVDKISKIKFKFRVRERNLKAIEIVKKQAIEDKQVKFVSFPIIF